MFKKNAPLLSEKALSEWDRSNAFHRNNKIENIKNNTKWLLWGVFYIGIILFAAFSIFIIVLFCYNLWYGIKSETVSYIFYEWLKLILYGIGSSLFKDALKNQFKN